MPVPMVNNVEFAHAIELLDRAASPAIVDRALREAGLTRKAVRETTGFLPYRLEARVLEHVARAIGDAHIGGQLAQHLDYGVYDAYARYVLGAKDLGSALARGKRALSFIHSGSRIVLRKRDGHVIVGRRSGLNAALGHRHLDDATLFMIGQVIRHFFGPDWKPAWAEITAVQAAGAGYLEEALGAPLRSGGDMPALAIPLGDLSAPNPAPPSVHQVVGFADLPALMGVEAPRSTIEEVDYVLRTQFVLGDMSEESVAMRLSVGRRTLQRWLKEEGTSFREVKARFIEARARTLLAESDLDTDVIAASLGYDEPKSFIRAFRGWTGLTPHAFRRRGS